MVSTLSLDHAWDDIDLGELQSPARPDSRHRRSRSDPSAIMQSIRAERNSEWEPCARPQWEAVGPPPEESEAVSKRNLSPAKATGFSPAMKKHASVAPARNSLLAPQFGDDPVEPPLPAEPQMLALVPSSSGVGADDDIDELALMPQIDVLAGPPFGSLAVPTADEFEAPAVGEKAAKNYSKKDVPMWTVEEDLLILQLVDQVRRSAQTPPILLFPLSCSQRHAQPVALPLPDPPSQHGKRWSKIASHLPGRTDNGVRNRWNRMERAQVLRQRRGPAAGYRCRRCGEPKRGHICAARTIGEQPEGEELQMKAAALTELSAQAMSATVEQTQLQLQQEQDDDTTSGATDGAAPAGPSLPMPFDGGAPAAKAKTGGGAASATALKAVSASAANAAPLTARPAILKGGVAATPAPPSLPTSSLLGSASGSGVCTAARLVGSSPFNAINGCVDNLGYASNVDDFLEELRRALDDTTTGDGPPSGRGSAERQLARMAAAPTPTASSKPPAALLAASPAATQSAAPPLPSSALGSAGCFFATAPSSHPSAPAGHSAGWIRDAAPLGVGLPDFDLLSPIGAPQSAAVNSAHGRDSADCKEAGAAASGKENVVPLDAQLFAAGGAEVSVRAASLPSEVAMQAAMQSALSSELTRSTGSPASSPPRAGNVF